LEYNMQVKVKIEKDKIRLSFPYDKEKVKCCQTMAMRWSKTKKEWSTPNNYMNRVCLNRLFPGILPPEQKEEIKELVIPSFLMDHQKEALRRAARQNRRGIFHDTGTGKSCTALEIYRHHKVKTLVICPLSLIEGAWFEEIYNRYTDIDASNLWAAKKRSPAAFGKALEKDLCIINYESFRTVDKKLANAGFKMAILDESARIRTWKKNSTADKVINFCDNVKYVYLLSGVPAPNSMLEYWSQIRILDPLLWGKSFYRFRIKYFNPGGYGGYTWEVKPECEKKLKEDIKTVAEYVNKADVLDLPGRTESMRVFQLSAEERKHYKNIKNDLVTIIEEEGTTAVTTPSAVTAIMKLRQISSGFLLDGDICHTIGNSKIKELLQLLEDIGEKQVIIWIQFKAEAQRIKEALQKKGIDSGILNSTTAENEKQNYLKAFKGGNIQYIICHPKSVGYGHTLTNCSEAIYYSYSYSYDDDYQSGDRIYRFGQKEKCSLYYLIADKTMDLAILRAVQKKDSTSMAILNYLKK